MAYESNSGLNIHNHYGPRSSGGEQGVYKTEGFRNEYVVDQASQGLQYLFPRGGGVFVVGHDYTYVSSGAVTSITIGGLDVTAATESAPIKIPDTNTGEVVVNGTYTGRVQIFFKKAAGYEEDILPAFPSDFDEAVSVTVSPATQSVAAGSTTQLTAVVAPSGAHQAVVWSSSAPSKATVSSTGLVTGVAAGSATITATAVSDGSVVGTSAITVTA